MCIPCIYLGFLSKLLNVTTDIASSNSYHGWKLLSQTSVTDLFNASSLQRSLLKLNSNIPESPRSTFISLLEQKIKSIAVKWNKGIPMNVILNRESCNNGTALNITMKNLETQIRSCSSVLRSVKIFELSTVIPTESIPWGSYNWWEYKLCI